VLCGSFSGRGRGKKSVFKNGSLRRPESMLAAKSSKRIAPVASRDGCYRFFQNRPDGKVTSGCDTVAWNFPRHRAKQNPEEINLEIRENYSVVDWLRWIAGNGKGKSSFGKNRHGTRVFGTSGNSSFSALFSVETFAAINVTHGKYSAYNFCFSKRS
jgi:hypothetical protein